MRWFRREALVVAALLSFVGCGTDGASSGDDGTVPSTNKPGSSSGETGKPNTPVPQDLMGVWSISGKDARGTYKGQAEVRGVDGKLQVIRTIAYDDVKVEDGRALHWAIVGEGKGNPGIELTLDFTLDNRGFIAKRGELERKLTDAPIKVTGKVKLADDGKGTATYSGPGIDGEETWQTRTPSAAEPIFAVNRSLEIGHDPPSALLKTTFWATYGSFRELPDVKPYVGRPEFEAAIHGHIVDTTDFDFYRKNPNALRVFNKTIDAISLQESLSRANAYRKTLAEKAAGFDGEIESEFIEPTTGMLLEPGPDGTTKQVHFSAALWTGIYMASQVFRFELTGDAKAKANAVKTLDGILKLQEVTGDWKQFARAIRPATGTTTDGWHAGTGTFSNLEWLEGGNNDMMKGLYIAYLLGHRMLCKSGNDPMCDRIRTNAKHLSDDINVDRGSDELDSAWLTSVVLSDPIKRVEYQGKTLGAWVASKPVIQNNTTLYEQGTADWSGLNLGFVGNVFHMLLAEQFDVGGDAKKTFQGVINDCYNNLKKQRLPLWNFLGAAYSGKPSDKAADNDALWRLREFPYPKSTHIVDRRVSPDYVMSPYPSLPWKNDWTTTDRTQALRSAPLFEDAMDVYRFRLEMKYRGESGKHAAPEYLIAYWFARKYNLIAATE